MGTRLTDSIVKMVRSKWFRLLVCIAAIVVLTVIGIVVALHSLGNITSSNAVVYLISHAGGYHEITNYVSPHEDGKITKLFDASFLFSLATSIRASVGRGHIEMSWNPEGGDGVIKEYRSDGSEFLISLSRYKNKTGIPNGLFIGGDLPLGDPQRTLDSGSNNTGIAYFNGKAWLHIWCSINEGLMIAGAERQYYSPEDWIYLGGRVLKSSSNEVLAESQHALSFVVKGGKPVAIRMNRKIYKKLDQDYLILEVSFVNEGSKTLTYTYEFGDEPWVGDFYRGSRGNVGWTDGMTYEYEGYVRTNIHRFAGYWDIGNSVIREDGKFTGVADFVEWLSEPPDYAYFANQFGYSSVSRSKPLSSRDSRVLGLVWLNQPLKPGERRTHILALGMAKTDPARGIYFPIKPLIVIPAE